METIQSKFFKLLAPVSAKYGIGTIVEGLRLGLEVIKTSEGQRVAGQLVDKIEAMLHGAEPELAEWTRAGAEYFAKVREPGKLKELQDVIDNLSPAKLLVELGPVKGLALGAQLLKFSKLKEDMADAAAKATQVACEELKPTAAVALIDKMLLNVHKAITVDRLDEQLGVLLADYQNSVVLRTLEVVKTRGGNLREDASKGHVSSKDDDVNLIASLLKTMRGVLSGDGGL